MRNKVRVVVVLLSALVLGGCTDIAGNQVITGRGPVVIESRSAGAFTSVSNSTVAEVEVLQGFDDQVWIRAEENLLPYLRTRVQDGVLRIYTDGVTLRPRQTIVVEVDVRNLRRLDSSGSGFMTAHLIDATRLEVNSSGSGSVEVVSLLADSLVIVSSGSGDVTASGAVDRLRVNMSAAGLVDTRELQAVQADVTISGSGSATIRVRDYLRAVLSGGGDLRYFGSPEVDAEASGSGSVVRAGS